MGVRGHNQPHRILESKLNSVKRSLRIALETKAQRFPELSVSLPELSKTLFTKAF
ncbi:hypothetical protein LEP1GSC041_2105 [Leptospira noguchii str. 2006001870]|nr:hypothetical protein LEP1GSC041_2105 [Leptospira noguchii str. 2006001870]